MKWFRRMSIVAMLVLAVGLMTACGGTEETEEGGTVESPAVAESGNTVDLNIDATNFKFDQDTYRVKAGDTVNVSFKSSQGMHGIEIQGLDVNLNDGESTTFVAQPGEYDIVCSIMCGSGHADMVSKLIVE
jgi:cytochrome c oxidase subunit 2